MFNTILGVIAVFVFAVFTYKSALAQKIPSISAQDAYGAQQADTALIIDVREETETALGMIKGAAHLPFSVWEDDKKAFDQLMLNIPKDKEIILYCRSGRRSSLVGAYLQKKGFKVKDLGAFQAWAKNQLPLGQKDCSVVSC